MFYYPLSENLELRLLEYRHSEALYRLIKDNYHHFSYWLPFIKTIESVNDTKQFIEKGLNQFYHNNGFQAGLWYEQTLIGVIGFHYIQWFSRKTSIGYWIAKPYEGQGFMTKACEALINHAFHNLALNRVEIRVTTENYRSKAIPERLGFKMEGVIRADEWLNDHYVDLAVFGLLKNEWIKE